MDELMKKKVQKQNHCSYYERTLAMLSKNTDTRTEAFTYFRSAYLQCFQCAL